MLRRLAAEPPIRLVAREFARAFARNPETRSRWGVEPYTPYLAGLLHAARAAKLAGIPCVTAIEFGVASGRGLLALEKHAKTVSRATGVFIRVVGFDSGCGLPEVRPDYRDHPDYWRSGDFPMDVAGLRRRLDAAVTELVIGPVRETVETFRVEHPVGFVSFDVDLYSSTRDALRIFGPNRNMLRRTACYFDDLRNHVSHSEAGEQRAIREFNASWNRTPDDPGVVIDEWNDLTHDKPFPEAPMWKRLKLAHDLRAIEENAAARRRDLRRL